MKRKRKNVSDSESEEEVYRPVQGRRGQGKTHNHFMNIQYEPLFPWNNSPTCSVDAVQLFITIRIKSVSHNIIVLYV